MINKVPQEVYYRHIAKFHEAMRNNQFKDQFRLQINREAPSMLFLNPYYIKSFTINYEGFSVDTSKLGTVNVNQITGVEPLSINVVFREKAREEIVKFLLFNDGGELPIHGGLSLGNIGHLITSVTSGNIVNTAIHYAENMLIGNAMSAILGGGNYIPPRDGSFLLPYEWYFNLTAYALDEKWSPMQILSGDFIIEGNIEKDFMSDDNTWQEVAITFKPIQSNKIKYHNDNGIAGYGMGLLNEGLSLL